MSELRKFGQSEDEIKYLTPATREFLQTAPLEERIKAELETLKKTYKQSQRQRLIPPLVRGDFLTSASIYEDDEDVDPESEADLNIRHENAKTKVGVIFGSDPTKDFGAKTKLTGPIILAKIFAITKGIEHRTQIQAAWANSLQDFYGRLLEGSEYEDFYKEQYGTHFAQIADLLNTAIEKINESVGRAEGLATTDESKSKRRRTIPLKGITVLALIPEQLKKRFFVDFTNAYLRTQGRNHSGSILATFVVPNDPFPFVWQAPQGANVVPAYEPQTISRGRRELKIEWESEQAREKYFPDGLWQPDVDEDGNVITEPQEQEVFNKETGETEIQTVEVPVYTLNNNNEYEKQLGQFQDKLADFTNYAHLDFHLQAIQAEASKKADGPEWTAYIDLAKQKHGGLTQREAKGPTPTASGILCYTLFARKSGKRQEIRQLVSTYKDIVVAQKRKDKEAVADLKDKLQTLVSKKFYGREVEPREAAELAFLFTTIESDPALSKIADGQYPRNVYDPNVYQKGVLPSSNQRVALDWVSPNGEQVTLKAKAKRNPFYTPKVWPSDMKFGDTSWPGRGAGGFKSKRIMVTHWRTKPWSNLDLEQKRNYIAEMREEAEKLASKNDEESLEELNDLNIDISIVEQSLFMDELRAYIKLNIAFNMEDSDVDSIVSKIEDPPALFYINRGGAPLAVTVDTLLNHTDGVKEYMGIDQNDRIDMTTDEESNYGFRYEQPDFIRNLLQKQLHRASLVSRLRRLAKHEKRIAQQEIPEMYFDLEGNQYGSEKELEQALLAKGDLYTVDDRVEVANMLRDIAAKALAQEGDEFVIELEQIQKELEQIQEAQPEPEPEPPQPTDTHLEIPSDTDQQVLPPIQFEQPAAERPLAAFLEKPPLKGFTKRT